jgi:hypothetical protein
MHLDPGSYDLYVRAQGARPHARRERVAVDRRGRHRGLTLP